MANLKYLKQSGSQCVGCGRGPKDGVMLMRLRSYARSLSCASCFMNPEYAKCANKNPLGIKCGHNPFDHYNKRGPCSIGKCGCQSWIHGLESEIDRLQADAVGKAPVSGTCRGFGGKTCDNVVFAGKNGNIRPLCLKCEREWAEAFRAGLEDVKKFLDLDPEKEIPQ